ncbi:hypothetical protein [Actinoplanes sp. NPDC049265]|uniref:hypothetical protein n=1 Tax=Actinoplanes sp. NPDC049265 TaxID=3363902 RepID=UPI00371D19AB
MVGNDAGATVRPPAVAGLGIAVCALTAISAVLITMPVAVRNTDWFSWIGWFGWATVPAIWPLLVAVLLAGLALVTRRRDGGVAAVVAFVCAAQLAGGGVAASRDWFNVGGAVGISIPQLAVLLPLTAVVIVASTVACCLALTLVKRHAAAARGGWWRPLRLRFVVLGGAVAVLVTIAGGYLVGGLQLTGLVQAALTWSLPWGCGLALAAWLDGPMRRAALLAVGASALATVAVLPLSLLSELW